MNKIANLMSPSAAAAHGKCQRRKIDHRVTEKLSWAIFSGGILVLLFSLQYIRLVCWVGVYVCPALSFDRSIINIRTNWLSFRCVARRQSKLCICWHHVFCPFF